MARKEEMQNWASVKRHLLPLFPPGHAVAQYLNSLPDELPLSVSQSHATTLAKLCTARIAEIETRSSESRSSHRPGVATA